MHGATVLSSGVNNVPIRIFDDSGDPLTTLDHTSAIDIRYRRSDQSSWTTITKVAGTLGTKTSDGFTHDSNGVYQLGLRAAAVAGDVSVLVDWSGSGIETGHLLLPIHAVDHQDSQRAGLASLPAANPGVETGMAILDANLRIAALVKAMDSDTLTAAAISADAGAELAAAVWQHATATATTAAIAAIKAVTDLHPNAGAFSDLASALSVLNNGTHGLSALKTLIDAATSAANAAAGTVQITESYAAAGVAPTRDQALMLIHQILQDAAIASTTRTVKKLDGSTTAATHTLGDATNPTTIARTS